MPAIRIGEATFEMGDEGRGDAVLLLHGFPTTRLLWRGVAPALAAAGWRVLTPDLLGYGKSVAPPDARPDMATQAAYLLRLLDALEVAKAVVIAHDVGSAAAQIMVATARDQAGSPHRCRPPRNEPARAMPTIGLQCRDAPH